MPKPKQRSKMSKVTLVFGEFVSKKFDLELETLCPMEGEVITELSTSTPMEGGSEEIILGVKEDNNNSGIAVTENCNKPSVKVTEDHNCSVATVTTGDTNNNFMVQVTEDDYNSTVAVTNSKDESTAIVTEDNIVSVGTVTEDKNEPMTTVAEDKDEPMETETVTVTEDNNGFMVPVPVIEDENSSVMTVTKNDSDPKLTATEDNNNCKEMVTENNSDCVVTMNLTKGDDSPRAKLSEDSDNSQATVTDTGDDNNSVVTMTVDQNNCVDSEDQTNFADSEDQTNFADSEDQTNFADSEDQTNFADSEDQTNFADSEDQTNFANSEDQNNAMDVEDPHNSVDTENQQNNYPGPCTEDDHHNNSMGTGTSAEGPFKSTDIENHDDSTAAEPLATLDNFHPVPVNEDEEEANVSKVACILSGVTDQLSSPGTSPPRNFIKPKRYYYACTLCEEALPDKPLALYHLVSFHYRELRSMGLSAEDNVANNDSLVNDLTVEVSGSVKPVEGVISDKPIRNPQNTNRWLANNKYSSEKPSKAEKSTNPRIHTDEKRLIHSLPKAMRFQHPDHSVEVIKKATVRIERLKFTTLPPALLAAAKQLCVKKSANHFVCKKCEKVFGSYNGCYNHVRVNHYGEHRRQGRQSGPGKPGRKKLPSKSKNSKVSSGPVIGTPTNRDIDRGYSKTKKSSPTLVKFNFAKLSKRTD